MPVLVKYILLETISIPPLFENIHRIGKLCANSKRKGPRRFTGCSSLSKRTWVNSPPFRA